MAYLIQNTITGDFIDDDGNWTVVRTFAHRFRSKSDAERYIDKHTLRGDDPYMKVVTESTHRSFKKFMEAKKTIKEDVDQKIVIHTKNGKVDSIEQGTYMPNGVFIRNGGHHFDKGFIGMDPQEAKSSLVKYSKYNPDSIIID